MPEEPLVVSALEYESLFNSLLNSLAVFKAAAALAGFAGGAGIAIAGGIPPCSGGGGAG